MNEHECVFVEEQEPNGRLVLPPCIVCGTTAMDALGVQRQEIREAAADLALSVVGEPWTDRPRRKNGPPQATSEQVRELFDKQAPDNEEFDAMSEPLAAEEVVRMVQALRSREVDLYWTVYDPELSGERVWAVRPDPPTGCIGIALTTLWAAVFEALATVAQKQASEQEGS